MKINKILMGLGAVAALSLGACSNDEPATNPEAPTFGQDKAYLAVQITEQTGRSRAEGDATFDPDYQDGTKYDESKVNSCDLYFYDEAGKYVMTSNIFWQNNGQEAPNIELKGQSVVVLDQVKEKNYPKYMVTVINKPAGFTAPLTLEEMNVKLTELAATTTDGAVLTDNGFIMTTAVYDNGKTYNFVNELEEKNFCTTPEEAKTLGKDGKAVVVYVERLAAKVTVKITESATFKHVEGLDNDNTYAIKLSVVGANNNDNDQDFTADYELYVQFLGWGLNATPTDSYYMKNLDWTDDNLAAGFTWNDPTFHRSYWAKSWVYNKEVKSLYNLYSYNDFSKGFWTADTKEGQNAAYTAENTQPKAFVNKKENFEKITSVVVKALVYDPKAAEGESSDFVQYNGLLFKGDRFMEYVLSLKTPNLYTETTTAEGTSYASAEYELVNVDKTNQVYVQVKEEAGATYVTKNEDGSYSPATAATVNANLIEIKGEGFKGGMMVYNIPIRHLRPIAKGDDNILVRTFAKQNLEEGDYGVVRNHCYAVSINSLYNIGTGVWNPDDEFIPTPPQDEQYYLGAQINILSWRVVNNDVDL